MKFLLKNAFKFGWDGLKGWSYSNSKDFSNASSAYIEVTGRHGKTKTTHSDRTYYVVGGQGKFVIDDKVFSVAKSDVIIVPKNTPYDFQSTRGTLKLLLVSTPAFEPSAEVKLE